MAGFCELGNEPSCSLKKGYFLTSWVAISFSNNVLHHGIDGGEWSTSRPGRLTPRERAPDTHWIGGWVDQKGWICGIVPWLRMLGAISPLPQYVFMAWHLSTGTTLTSRNL
jgi:hypothetical protein